MSGQSLDLRYPEAYLRDNTIDCSVEQMNNAINLGEDYRQLKIILKQDIELKKGLSKEFVEISGNPKKKRRTLKMSGTPMIKSRQQNSN